MFWGKKKKEQVCVCVKEKEWERECVCGGGDEDGVEGGDGVADAVAERAHLGTLS